MSAMSDLDIDVQHDNAGQLDDDLTEQLHATLATFGQADVLDPLYAHPPTGEPIDLDAIR
jgi:hypothetical protein